VSAEHVVCRADELPPGERRLVRLGDRSIGVFNVAGSFYALHDRCPHHGGPLCRGRVGGTTASPAGYELQQVRDGEILRCAWHGWEFEISSGRMLADPRVRARTYPVEVLDGEVVVRLGASEGSGDAAAA
jgi:nitrite reductase/ring-hydroxylating ferredoxin subunit